eukprot:6882797-Prymnesium_polylepis.1
MAWSWFFSREAEGSRCPPPNRTSCGVAAQRSRTEARDRNQPMTAATHRGLGVQSDEARSPPTAQSGYTVAAF